MKKEKKEEKDHLSLSKHRPTAFCYVHIISKSFIKSLAIGGRLLKNLDDSLKFSSWGSYWPCGFLRTACSDGLHLRLVFLFHPSQIICKDKKEIPNFYIFENVSWHFSPFWAMLTLLKVVHMLQYPQWCWFPLPRNEAFFFSFCLSALSCWPHLWDLLQVGQFILVFGTLYPFNPDTPLGQTSL